MNLLELNNGKIVSIDSKEINQEDALEIAARLVNIWGQVHPRVNVILLYEADVKVFSECPHYGSLEDALESEGWK